MILTPTMIAAVKYANQHHGKIVRHPGGFWAHETWRYTGYNGGESFGTTTIEGLVKRGFASYTKWQQGQYGRFPTEMTVTRLEVGR